MRRPFKWMFEVAVPPFLLFVLVLILWQIGTAVFKPPAYLVPSPARILAAARDNMPRLLSATGLTALAALCGFSSSFLAGSLIAFLFSQSRLVQRSFYPYAIFLQTVPIVAIAPLVIIWFGNGFQSVVVVSFILSLFPVITNGTAGLTSVDRSFLELFELNNATRWQALFKLRLPNSIPYLVTGAKISSGLSVIGAIVGEFFVGYGSRRFGLGYLIMQLPGQLKSDFLFATIFASTLLGLAIFGTVSLVGNAITSRWEE